MRIIDGVGYAPLPRELKGKRNVVCDDSAANIMSTDGGPYGAPKRGKNSTRKESGPKFRSERNRRGARDSIEDEVSTHRHVLDVALIDTVSCFIAGRCGEWRQRVAIYAEALPEGGDQVLEIRCRGKSSHRCTETGDDAERAKQFVARISISSKLKVPRRSETQLSLDRK
jgi:hypothetical protein